jgi:hypothetical protein
MSRDYLNDIDRLGRQLSELRRLFARQAVGAADDATAYAAPRMRQIADLAQREGRHLVRAAGKSPTTATGTVLAALAVGTVLGLFLAGAVRRDE